MEMIYITKWTGFSGENWRLFSLFTDISEQDTARSSQHLNHEATEIIIT
jgi:hypothetical protein